MASPHGILLLLLIGLATLNSHTNAYESKSLRMIANFFSSRLLEQTLNPDSDSDAADAAADADATAAAAIAAAVAFAAKHPGNSTLDFVWHIAHADRRQCSRSDEAIELLATATAAAEAAAAADADADEQGASGRGRPPIRLNCRRGHGNGTMLVIDSYKDLWHLIAPWGNVTGRHQRAGVAAAAAASSSGKRRQSGAGRTASRLSDSGSSSSSPTQQPGNCALLLFHSPACYMSSKLAPQYNPMAALFPDLRVGAIDAVRFHEMNTELGIVGLPTLMLFHQAQAVVRFNGTLSTKSLNFQTLAEFVTEHTGIESRLKSDETVVGAAAAQVAGAENEPFVLRPEHFEGPLDGRLVVERDWCLWLAWWFIGVCGLHGFGRSRVYAALVEYVKRNWRESVER